MTKIKANIHKEGFNNSAILAMVAANNSGRISVDIPDIKGLLKWRQTEYPAMTKEVHVSKDSGESTIHIYEDWKGEPTLTLEWVEVYDLATNPDDIKDVKFN